MKIETLHCPNCGGDLNGIEIKDGKSEVFCPYCGTKVFLNDDNTKTYIHKHIDTAREKELELQGKIVDHQEILRKEGVLSFEREMQVSRKVFLGCPAVMMLGAVVFALGLSTPWRNLVDFGAPLFFTSGAITIIAGLVYRSKSKAYYKLVNPELRKS